MELTFRKEGSKYIAEFSATADFNLHLEREVGGFLYVSQRTSASGQYDSIKGGDFAPKDKVVDYDFTALVYPKFIKVVSEVEPSYAAVVSDGEVTEIKSQSKEIEVTSNGTTVVEPDAGFAYLNKVSVKTNVEGQGGGGSVGVKYTYYDFRGWMDNGQPPMAMQMILATGAFVNIKRPDKDNAIMPIYGFLQQFSQTGLAYIKGLAIDYNAPFKAETGVLTNTREYILGLGVSESDLSALKEITEEEFYAL